MKNNKALLESIDNLKDAFRYFISELENYEHENKTDINDLIVKDYPFNKDLYEQYCDILDWAESIENNL